MIHETKPTRDQRAVADACVADYVAALARLEADPLLDDFGRAQPFHAIWQRVQGVGLERDESLQRIVYEALVWDLHAKTPEPGERHGQRWSSIPWSENGHNTLDPAASVARPGFYTHLAERVLATPSPMHRARYADVLWELDGGFQRAHAAATAYLAALPLLASTESERRHDAIVRALQLGLQIQEAEIVATARQALLGELTPPVVATAADDALALLPWLLQLPDRFVTNAELAQGRQYAEGAATILSADGEAGLFRARFAFELAAQFARRLRDAAGEQRLLLALGEAIEAQAAAAARRSRLDEGELLRKAFAHYASLGFAEQATTVKLRLEAAQGASEPEFNTFRQTIELDTEALDRLATALAGLPPPQSLAFIATRPGWYPEKAALAARADALRRQVPLLGAMGRRRFSMDGRLVDEATSDADLQQAQIFDLYNLWARGWGCLLYTSPSPRDS